jgi:hypothetical protein
MNNGLQLYNNPSLPALLATNSYANALLTTKPMCELAQKEAKNHILDCIISATFIGGWNKKDDQDLVFMVNSIMPDIEKRFKMLTQAEVKSAFDNGAKGQYGETFGISPAACLKWLTAYYMDAERLKAKKEIEKLKAAPIVQKLSRGEKRQAIQIAYAKFKETGSYHDYGNHIYNSLDAERLIAFTGDQKREFLERGRKIIYDRLQCYKDLAQKRENDKKIEALMDDDTTPIIEGKRVALREYFLILSAAGFKEIIFQENCLKF